MEKPAVAMIAQFMRDMIHRMADLVYLIDVNDTWSSLLGRRRLVYIPLIAYN